MPQNTGEPPVLQRACPKSALLQPRVESFIYGTKAAQGAPKETALTEDGHCVSCAGSATEALGLVDAARCDLVLSDLRLPGTDGIGLLTEIKRRWPGIHFVMMTAFADVSTTRDALKGGAFDYLVKPFQHDELMDIVNHVLAIRLSNGMLVDAEIPEELAEWSV